MNAVDVLIKYWGYTSFRLKQEEIINSIMAKKDTLALLPTGGGKSICFQVPCLMNDGICIVISPLISLMNDQVLFLKSKGIKSVAISSDMRFSEIDTTLTNCIYGGIKFLYLSPEKLSNKLVQTRIKEMNVNLITVDEAHCISEWGHNFRPSFRHINEIREILPNAPVLALTATATSSVINDIQECLNFKQKNLIKSSFKRSNLSYVVDNVEDKKSRLIKLLNKIKSSVIIYVGSRKAAKDISNYLVEKKFSANFYHAGLSEKIRYFRQERWMKNQIRIMVATNAFGMGINKTDVKLVVHMDIPATIEAYFQEAGRAGRNGKNAYAFLLANSSDLIKQKKLLSLRYPSTKDIKKCYQDIANYLQIAEGFLPTEPIPFNIIKFNKRYNLTYLKTFNILKYLEKEELIKISDTFNTPSKLRINITTSELYKFQISNKYYDRFIKLLLRSYVNILNNYVFINEQKLAERYNSDVTEINRLLINLQKLEIVQYQKQNSYPQLTFIKPRKDAESLQINELIWAKRKDYENNKLNRISEYISTDKTCRSKMLLHYFGEENLANCGVCDVCVLEKRKNINDKEFLKIKNKIKKYLQSKEYSFEEILTLFPNTKRHKIINIINFLFDNDYVGKYGNKYHWRE